jgi:hypothetical protein
VNISLGTHMGIWEDLLLCYKGMCIECFINIYFLGRV